MFKRRDSRPAGEQLREPLVAAATRLAQRQRPGDLEDALETQRHILHEFAAALDLSFLETRGNCDTEHGPFLIIGGLFVATGRQRRPRNATHDHVRVMVWEQSLCGQPGSGLLADIVELELPATLQGRGLGACLLNMLAQTWRRLGVAEVRAVAGSQAGEKAFASWGFREVEDADALKQFWMPLTAS